MTGTPSPSETPASPLDALRARIEPVLCSRRFERFITGLIVLNAITLGLETSKSAMAAAGTWLMLADQIILAIFVVEIAARMLVKGLRFWRDPWCLFDFFVVGIALVPSTGNLSVLRALRIIRALRLISTVESMRRVVGGLLHAIPGMGSIVALLGLIFYVFSVMATKLFAADFPQWFGTIGESAYSLFQIMTLESWSMGIVRPVMETHPWAWAFFVPFILVTSFTVLNLFIGIIVDAMQSQHEAEEKAEKEAQAAELDEILREVRALREEVRGLRGQSGGGS
ncbi:MAG: ion transporter [Hyphomicrobiales bacterium]|nr:ion transporter [Hyphomicrobiales bacterium]